MPETVCFERPAGGANRSNVAPLVRQAGQEVECIPHAWTIDRKSVAKVGQPRNVRAPIVDQTSRGAVTSPSEPRSGIFSLARCAQASIAFHRPSLEKLRGFFLAPNETRTRFVDKGLCAGTLREARGPDRWNLREQIAEQPIAGTPRRTVARVGKTNDRTDDGVCLRCRDRRSGGVNAAPGPTSTSYSRLSGRVFVLVPS